MSKCFESLVGKEILIFDGAMGTELIRQNVSTEPSPEILSVTAPQIIEDIHFNYLMSGSQIITTNTFGANAYKMGERFKEVIVASIQCAQNAKQRYLSLYPDKKVFIAYDMGPIGALMAPNGQMMFDEAYDLYSDQVKIVSEQPVDLFLIETQTDLREAKCAILACKENASLPVVCTMSFEATGRTFTGTDIRSMAVSFESLGVSAIGLNCSFGTKEMIPLVDLLLKNTNLPVMVQPNAGMPKIIEGISVYEMATDNFVKDMVHMYQLGVSILGGCCGTTSREIKALAKALNKCLPVTRKIKMKTRVASYAKTVEIGRMPLLVGERINPTGKPLIKEALIKNALDHLLREAVFQVMEGAQLLDVNIGMPEIDEATLFPILIENMQSMVDVPLQIDSSNPEAIEAAVRSYAGKPIINSVNGKEESLKTILPIVKKYGACVIGLTLDEDGIPESVEKRIEIAKRISDRAIALGIPKQDLIIDCLTLTASAQQESVYETLEALKIVKDKLGLCTTLGVSNVSFGLPNRHPINLAFMTLALDYGLDLVIANPGQSEMVEALDAFKVLRGLDCGSKKYIEKYHQKKALSDLECDDLNESILRGLKNEAIRATKTRLKIEQPIDIINNGIIPALNQVGELFERGDLFLPQLIQSAHVVQKVFDLLKSEWLVSGETPYCKGKILLATVEHDVHDIGKNIVKLVLQNYGYEVIDLGKDVRPERVLDMCLAENIRLVGLSALMTTTVKSMEKTIELLKTQMATVEVVVGGAVLTQALSERIGADYYAKDPAEIVRIANRVFMVNG